MHAETRAYICPICECSCATHTGLRRHFTMAHGEHESILKPFYASEQLCLAENKHSYSKAIISTNSDASQQTINFTFKGEHDPSTAKCKSVHDSNTNSTTKKRLKSLPLDETNCEVSKSKRGKQQQQHFFENQEAEHPQVGLLQLLESEPVEDNSEVDMAIHAMIMDYYKNENKDICSNVSAYNTCEGKVDNYPENVLPASSSSVSADDMGDFALIDYDTSNNGKPSVSNEEEEQVVTYGNLLDETDSVSDWSLFLCNT